VLKALDESGVKIDLLVGSGSGAVAAAYGAAAGGARLHGKGGFWDDARWSEFYRLRPVLRVALLLLGCSFGVFLLPVALALLVGLLFPLGLMVSLASPSSFSGMFASIPFSLDLLRTSYVAAFAAPVFVLAVVTVVVAAHHLLRDRTRFAESLEAVWDERGARMRIREGLWQIARGPALSSAPARDVEIGEKYVALLSENLGQPGFRELIIRAADLETGGVLPFALLEPEYAAGFASARARDVGAYRRSAPEQIDLRAPGAAALLFDAVLTGLLAPFVTTVRRVRFPRGGLYGGEIHRLTDATLAGGSGVSEALAAGAEQVILVGGVPEIVSRPTRRRGPKALAGATLGMLERQSFERELSAVEKINRLVSTLGHDTERGPAWEDPASGRLYREVGLWVVRPERRALGPLEFDGSRDPATEVEQHVEELVELGYRDAYRLFVEPIVGATTEPDRAGLEGEESLQVEL
jgi:hypothetical protein